MTDIKQFIESCKPTEIKVNSFDGSDDYNLIINRSDDRLADIALELLEASEDILNLEVGNRSHASLKQWVWLIQHNYRASLKRCQEIVEENCNE